jgi:hypothetical protein
MRRISLLDSTVLAYVMKLLNDRYSYGLDLVLLSIDEGITGYRDDSLETVKRNRDQYQIPLLIVSYKDLYGWSMDDIVKEIGRKNNCKFRVISSSRHGRTEALTDSTISSKQAHSVGCSADRR